MKFKRMNLGFASIAVIASVGMSIGVSSLSFAQGADDRSDNQPSGADTTTDMTGMNNGMNGPTGENQNANDNNNQGAYSPMGVAVATSSPTRSLNETSDNPQNPGISDNNVAAVNSPVTTSTTNADGSVVTTTIVTTTTRNANAAAVTPGNGGTLTQNGIAYNTSPVNLAGPAPVNSQAAQNVAPPVPAPGNDAATSNGNQYAQQQQVASEDAPKRAGHPAIYWILIVLAIIGGIYYAIQNSGGRPRQI